MAQITGSSRNAKNNNFGKMNMEHTEILQAQLDRLKKLREPFPPNQISILCRSTKKDNQKGKCPKCGGWHGLPAIQLSYVGHAALTDRLLDVDPMWTWEPVAFDSNGAPLIDKDGGMWIRLTVCGVTRLGYGDAQGKTGGDAMKERIGDALRNAAMRFGAALDLWHKGDLHVDDDEPKPAQQSPVSPQQDSAEEANADVIELMNACENISALTKVMNGLPQEKRKAYNQHFQARMAELKISV